MTTELTYLEISEFLDRRCVLQIFGSQLTTKLFYYHFPMSSMFVKYAEVSMPHWSIFSKVISVLIFILILHRMFSSMMTFWGFCYTRKSIVIGWVVDATLTRFLRISSLMSLHEILGWANFWEILPHSAGEDWRLPPAVPWSLRYVPTSSPEIEQIAPHLLLRVHQRLMNILNVSKLQHTATHCNTLE